MDRIFACAFFFFAVIAYSVNFEASRIEKVRFPEGKTIYGAFVQNPACPAGWGIASGSEPVPFCAGMNYQGCGNGQCGIVSRRETVPVPGGFFNVGNSWCSVKTCPNNQQYFCGSRFIAIPPCAIVQPAP